MKKNKQFHSLSKRIPHFWIFIALFTLSGFCGIVYEVVWSRLAILIFGSTTYAVSSVLGVFFFGLAMGSWLCGKYIEKIKNLIRFYSYLEFGIGAYAMIFLLLLSAVQALHSLVFPYLFENSILLNLFRIFLSFILLLPPTLMMGATVPILGRALTRSPGFIGTDFGIVYAYNTFGAAFGSFSSAFILIPFFGLKVSIIIGAAINLLVGLGAFKLSEKEYNIPEKTPVSDKSKIIKLKISPAQAYSVIIGFMISGFLGLVYEVAWSRALILVFGTSVYAFATMLTTYLIGIALGSICMGRFADRIKNHFLWFSIVQIIIGISIFITTPLIGKLPYFFVNHFKINTSWNNIIFTEFAVCFLIMIIPAFSSGMLFPLVTKIFMNQRKFKIGRTIADVYSFNTFGAIIGSFAAGFIFIPFIGIEKTLLLGAMINCAGASVLFLFSDLDKKQGFIYSGMSMTFGICAFFFLQTWNPLVMNSGVYLYSDNLAKMEKKIDTFASDYKMLFYREGPSATVSVLEKDNNRFLRINGKTDGSNVTGQRNDNYTQTLLGLLPMIYNEKKEKALVIGVGTGITIGSLLDYPGVKVDCVEISQAVVEASRFFNDSNGNALDSPRTSTHILDGRTWLMSMPKKYDMIISEPSHPWQTGNANLFTTDFFDLSVKKLDKGGVFCQWLPYYRMDQEHFKILVNSFKNIFNYVNAWIIYTDVILIGSDSPLSIDYQLLEDFISADSIKNRLAGININSIPDLLSFFYLDTQGVNKFIDKTKTLNTDNNPVIEFSAPKYLLKYQRAESFYEMLKYSLNSKIPVANTDNIKSIEKDRIYKRIEYFKQWGIPEHAALAMLEAYGY
ncbi:Spermine/spermidine synthase domain-containing protein [Desulfonema limicola]|uniref:Spermine/spermidine synthase domain-containing protein n=1 Tax=Desulfonema limicola TaxID=45656 RepID=A0A975BDA7_9BACT|nr:fused MFS/spermidine synthase [Desulfonema limicola]QTA83080.1 Spermine/spermidine synthase domain-containing protein [Desulfonema limicola]